MKQFVRSRIRSWHRLVAKSPSLSRGYLRLTGAFARSLPSKYLRHLILNQMTQVVWPEIELPAVKVELAAGCRVRLVPHFEEFDFIAQFDTDLDYEPEVFTWLAKRRYDTIVEIGANVGVYSVFFSSLVEARGKVLVFEPSAEAFRRLLGNLRANRITNVQAYNCAISDRHGLVSFFEPEGHLTNCSLLQDFTRIFSDHIVERKVLSLSGASLLELVPEGRVLLKIDVEGAEELVLRAAEPLISTRRPDILIEVLQPFEDSLNSVGYLKEIGYHFYNLRPGGPVEQPQFVAANFRDYALTPALLS